MYVRGEVAYGRGDALVEGAAEGQMAAQTHASGTDAAGAGREGEEGRDGEGGVFVIGVNFLSKPESELSRPPLSQRPSGGQR